MYVCKENKFGMLDLLSIFCGVIKFLILNFLKSFILWVCIFLLYIIRVY